MTQCMVIPTSAEEAVHPLTETVPGDVSHIASTPADPTEMQRLRLMELSGTYDFWSRPEEDIYSLDDGQPI